MKELGLFILFSLIFHFLVSTSSLYFAEKYSLAKKAATTEIEFLDSNDKSIAQKIEETKKLIKQLKSTVQEIKDNNIKARFESEEKKRVIKETRAQKLGLAKNATAPLIQQTKTNQEKDYDTDLEKLTTKNQNWPVSTQSTISAILPSDIDTSNATNLNTDAGIYYSFYSRVEDLFYVRWVEKVRYYWSRIDNDYKQNVLAGKIWSTTLEIWLTSTGEYHSAYVKQSSGYKPFDDSAIFAFKSARFFPNPPRAKVEADGFVRLRYRFNIQVDGN